MLGKLTGAETSLVESVLRSRGLDPLECSEAEFRAARAEASQIERQIRDMESGGFRKRFLPASTPA